MADNKLQNMPANKESTSTNDIVRRHLENENDTISEDDIRNVDTNSNKNYESKQAKELNNNINHDDRIITPLDSVGE